MSVQTFHDRDLERVDLGRMDAGHANLDRLWRAPRRRRRRGFGLTLAAFLSALVGLALLVAVYLPEPGQNAGPQVPSQVPSVAPSAASAVPPPPAAAGASLAAAPRASTPSSGASSSPWIDIVRPIRIFDLTAPELAKAPLVYAAERHATGGGRQDILTFGSLDAPAYLRLQLYRVGTEAAPAMPLYVDFTRAAASANLAITRSLPPAEMPTRFGPFEVSDLTLAQKSGAAVPCLGFRGMALSGGFRVLGFACGGRTLALSRPALGCLIDRLDLAEAGDDQALAGFFAASELRRNPACAGSELRPSIHRASWLDRNDAPPPLQGKKPL